MLIYLNAIILVNYTNLLKINIVALINLTTKLFIHTSIVYHYPQQNTMLIKDVRFIKI